MNEKLLQFIWQFGYFAPDGLKTAAGEALQIISRGSLNRDQGPDFLNARIKIGDTLLAGNIELHVHTSDWLKHGHDDDPHYRNIILHVVFTNDTAGALSIPVLELEPRISMLLLERYSQLMHAPQSIPCSKFIPGVHPLTWQAWKDRLVMERLQRRTTNILSLLKKNNAHWEEVCWWALSRSFGGKVNGEAFEAIAKSIPFSTVLRYRNRIQIIEALLFGQAGMLEAHFQEDYPLMLQKEYRFFRKKYGLHPFAGHIYFLRMRPGNFPSVRLAQLSKVIHQSGNFFTKCKEAISLSELMSLLRVTANDYWHYHYRFDEISAFHPKKVGADTASAVVINAIIPVLFAYGLHLSDHLLRERTIEWLARIESETNALTRLFTTLGISNATAADSQALIELKTEYCDARRCLECAVGNAMLRQEDGAPVRTSRPS